METVKTRLTIYSLLQKMFEKTTKFILIYMFLYVFSIVSALSLIQLSANAHNLVVTASTSIVARMILMISFFTMSISFVTFWRTVLEASVVNALEEEEGKISFLKSQLPLDKRFSGSILLNEFRMRIIAKKFNWSEKILSDFEKYLKTIFFVGPRWVSHLTTCLLLSGIAGTGWGVFTTNGGKGNLSAEVILSGIQGGVVSIILAVSSAIILATLNHIVVEERMRIFLKLLVILNTCEEKGDLRHDA